MKTLTRGAFADFVNGLSLIECIHERCRTPEIQNASTNAEQVIMHSHQFREDGPNVDASRSQLDPQQLFNRMMPSDFVGHRRYIVHAVNDGDVLIEIQYLAELFEAAMQETDIGFRIDDHLAIELQHQTQRCVCCGMLRPEIQRPKTVAFAHI